jgi:hypothetical protein
LRLRSSFLFSGASAGSLETPDAGRNRLAINRRVIEHNDGMIWVVYELDEALMPDPDRAHFYCCLRHAWVARRPGLDGNWRTHPVPWFVPPPLRPEPGTLCGACGVRLDRK